MANWYKINQIAAMMVSIKVKPNAKQELVRKISFNNFEAALKAKPQDGKANQALIRLLAKYFKVAKASVKIKSGFTARLKRIEIS